MTLSELLNKLTEEFRVGKQIFFSGNFVQMLSHSFSASCVVLFPPKFIYENSLGVIGRLYFLSNKFNRGTFQVLEAIHYNSKKKKKVAFHLGNVECLETCQRNHSKVCLLLTKYGSTHS